MTCTPISVSMRQLLETLGTWPDVNVDELKTLPEWREAMAWGWVMESGELTGTGLAHAKELPAGLVKE